MNTVQTTTVKSCLVACSGCGYWFWTSEEEAELLRGDGDHCSTGRWQVDHDALSVPYYGTEGKQWWSHP